MPGDNGMAPRCFLPIRRGPAGCLLVPRKGQRKQRRAAFLPVHWPRPHQPQQAGPGAASWPPAGGRGPAQCGRGKALSFSCSERAAAAGAAGGGSPLLLQQRRRRPRRQNSRGLSPVLQRPSETSPALWLQVRGGARLSSARNGVGPGGDFCCAATGVESWALRRLQASEAERRTGGKAFGR